tara:strand:- start:36603 stop:36707 length:105 start_codon:yes stop_codon:yes gene_type:complete
MSEDEKNKILEKLAWMAGGIALLLAAWGIVRTLI